MCVLLQYVATVPLDIGLPFTGGKLDIYVRAELSVNGWTAQLSERAEWVEVDCVMGVTYTDWRVWFVGLSHFQHSSAAFLLKCTRNVAFPYTQSLAKAAIFVYSVKAVNSTAEVE